MKKALSQLPAQPERGTLRIAELYSSRQGEGELTGTDSVFIRISGCNLRCWFCDTPFASWEPEGEQHGIDQLVTDVRQEGLKHVVITGGEPMLFPGVSYLLSELKRLEHHVTIETAGTVMQDISGCDLMSISPKLRASGPREQGVWQRQHEQRRWKPDVIADLITRSVRYQLKFVVDRPDEKSEVLGMLRALSVEVDPACVWIMPQARSVDELDAHGEWLQPWCDEQQFRYCDRKQLRWYGARRGT